MRRGRRMSPRLGEEAASRGREVGVGEGVGAGSTAPAIQAHIIFIT